VPLGWNNLDVRHRLAVVKVDAAWNVLVVNVSKSFHEGLDEQGVFFASRGNINERRTVADTLFSLHLHNVD